MLLLDIGMPGMNGLEVARRLAERGDDVKVVMLSAREDRDALFSAISAGARGYVAKDAEPEQLYAAIDLVVRGGTVLSTGVAANLGEGIRQLDYAPGAYEQRRLELTDRELEILRMLATPRSPAQIAAELFLSKKTVQNHISAIYRKLERGEPLRGHHEGHGAAPHRRQGLRLSQLGDASPGSSTRGGVFWSHLSPIALPGLQGRPGTRRGTRPPLAMYRGSAASTVPARRQAFSPVPSLPRPIVPDGESWHDRRMWCDNRRALAVRFRDRARAVRGTVHALVSSFAASRATRGYHDLALRAVMRAGARAGARSCGSRR